MIYEAQFATLEAFVDIVAALPEALSGVHHATRPAHGAFSLLEHVHHLADLEGEGFAVRLARLLAEDSPHLPDFEGGRLARERRYAERDIASGVARFTAARRANVERLRAVRKADWTRAGSQENVGRVTLGQLPARMIAHDCSHARELVELLEGLAAEPGSVLGRLRALGHPGGPCANAAA